MNCLDVFTHRITSVFVLGCGLADPPSEERLSRQNFTATVGAHTRGWLFQTSRDSFVDEVFFFQLEVGILARTHGLCRRSLRSSSILLFRSCRQTLMF